MGGRGQQSTETDPEMIQIIALIDNGIKSYYNYILYVKGRLTDMMNISELKVAQPVGHYPMHQTGLGSIPR